MDSTDEDWPVLSLPEDFIQASLFEVFYLILMVDWLWRFFVLKKHWD